MRQVHVRTMRPSDVAAVMAACQDWHELSTWGPPYWRPRATSELERKIAVMSGPTPATEYTFVIVDDDALVGECSLHAIDWRSGVAQVGVCVWEPALRRQGYGRYAVQALIRWANEGLGLSRLEAWILSGNLASQELFRSAGFTQEGVLRGRYRQGGVQRDVCVFGLLLQE